MLPNLERYYRPNSISEALALLQEKSGAISILAGGTRIAASQNDTIRDLMDVSGLNLNYVIPDMGLMRVGATTTLQELVDNQNLKKIYGGTLSEAICYDHPERMKRNRSTVGGELITTDSQSALYCSLLVLQAQVRIAGGEEFALAMNIFLNKKDIAGGLLMEVLIPYLKRQTYVRMAIISTNGKSPPLICAGVRLSLRNGICEDVKIALTGTQKVPQRFQLAESLLEKSKLDSSSIAMAADAVHKKYAPVADSQASQEYRKEASRLVVKRALNQCLEAAEEEMF